MHVLGPQTHPRRPYTTYEMHRVHTPAQIVHQHTNCAFVKNFCLPPQKLENLFWRVSNRNLEFRTVGFSVTFFFSNNKSEWIFTEHTLFEALDWLMEFHYSSSWGSCWTKMQNQVYWFQSPGYYSPPALSPPSRCRNNHFSELCLMNTFVTTVKNIFKFKNWHILSP